MKIILALAVLGHILCGICDCLLSYNGKKRIDFKCIGEPERMAKEFEGMPLWAPLISMLLGVFAITMFGSGYVAMSGWVYGYSHVCGILMFCGTVLLLVSGGVHHVIFGAIEWFYIKMGRTAQARESVLDFMQKTIVTMFACYAGWAIFLIPLIVATLAGTVPLPKLSCLFNTLPVMLILAPTKLPAKGNIAGAVMFLCLAFVI